MDITQNYFELFGLTPVFELDQSLLSSRYRELQQKWHPDRHAHLSEREQRLAVQYAAHLNEALATLKSPLRRAQYLLKLAGRDTHGETREQLDPLFLMQQMELRERLADVPEAADPDSELADLQSETERMLREMQNEFVLMYDAANLDAAEVLVRKMQFLTKLHSEIGALEERLYED